MLKTGILIPLVLELIAWVRQSKAFAIAGGGFPFWS